MGEIDKKNLSKLKYIYNIYDTGDGVLHCEQYPIIYINSEVIYFKDGRKKTYLSFVSLGQVAYSLEDCIKNEKTYVPYGGYYNTKFQKYVLTTSENLQELYDKLWKHRILAHKEQEKKLKYEKLEVAKKQYATALREVEKMEIELKKLEDEE